MSNPISLNLVIKKADGKPYLGYFSEFGEEIWFACHSEATDDEILDGTINSLNKYLYMQRIQSEFLSPTAESREIKFSQQ